MGRHPLLRWFEREHENATINTVYIIFRRLAQNVEQVTQPGAEQTTALRKLLEAKDAAVRAAIEKHEVDTYNAEAATKA